MADFTKAFTREVSISQYSNQSDVYITPTNRHDGIQYSHIYFQRLSEMKPRLLSAAKEKWGSDVEYKDLKDISPLQICFVIGTIFKEMSLAPCTIKEISDHHRLLPHPPRMKYSTSNDKILLEDHVQRIPLTGIDSSNLTTGVIVALKGAEDTNGVFEVSDFCFAGVPTPRLPVPSLNEDKYVLLVSGLMVGSDWSDQWAIQQLVDYVTGQLGGPQDQELMSKIIRVIIAGNSITNKPKIKSDPIAKTKVKYRSRNYAAESVEAMKELDMFLSQLASNVPADIMPGSYDPTNTQLPQQPFHHCMFPEASRHSTFKSVTNPYQCSIEGYKFIGTSGENIDNLYSCTEGLDSMELLERTLEWSHIAPTSPDTLCCYPYSRKDPFILSSCPQVYFAGNQPHFQTKQYQVQGHHNKVLLVCVPVFDITHTCVLVNLKTLTCIPLSFSTSLQQGNTAVNPNLEPMDITHQELITQDIDSD